MKRELMGLIVKRADGSEEVNYDNPSFPSYIYDGWIRPNVTWEKVPHFHEDIEILSVKSGRMAYSINGKILELNAGDTIFVNSNQLHYALADSAKTDESSASDSPLTANNSTATYVIFVANPSLLNSSVAVEMQALLPVLNNPNLPFIRFRNINENTEDIYNIMMSLPDIRRDPFQVTKKFFEIWEIILTQSKSYGMIDEDIDTDIHTKSFKAMMHFIQQEYQNPITLDDISNSGHISKSLCNNVFHKYVGESPVNYLLNYRIRKVAEYLRTTSLPLSEIAGITGFNSTSYMSEMFRKHFEMPPRDYRKTWNEI